MQKPMFMTLADVAKKIDCDEVKLFVAVCLKYPVENDGWLDCTDAVKRQLFRSEKFPEMKANWERWLREGP
jgi:hypothetical protein